VSGEPQLPTLLVFLKHATPGQVKTRLAEAIGSEEAARLYRQWISLVLDKLQPLRRDVRLIGYFDGATLDKFDEWRSLADEWWPQPTTDLGSRLEAGFQRAFAAGALCCLAVGTDCLELESRDVTDAIEKLKSNQAVFGPAEDGGYYLIGTRPSLPGFFDGIRWSSQHTLQDHLRRCNNNGWSVQLLPCCRRDIDSYDDLLAHRQERSLRGAKEVRT
jgi:rSAM/selenodomain-associated transferase 1